MITGLSTMTRSSYSRNPLRGNTGTAASNGMMPSSSVGSRDLEAWLTAIEADDGQPDLRSLAAGMRSDQQPVVNGLTFSYSSGKVEGIVNKMLKRQMYGRASLALLRKRVILHPALPDHKFAEEPHSASVEP